MNIENLLFAQLTALVTDNDGCFVELELRRIEGVRGPGWATIHLFIEERDMTEEEFLREFPVGMSISIRALPAVSLDDTAQSVAVQ